jgi:glc operon protein GlcG
MKKICLSCTLWLSLMTGFSQTQKPVAPVSTPPVLYGAPISLSQAEKMMTAALQEAARNGWPMAVAIVDTGGNLVAFERMDNTQIGSVDVAIGKAKTANNFKRPTKAFEDLIANGGAGLRILSLPGAVALEGGEPILLLGKIIGGIGVSGMKSTEDDQVAKAGLNALN